MSYIIWNPYGPYILLLIGAIFFFSGRCGTGKGVFARFHYVDTGTPEIVWKIFGVLLWIIGIVIIVFRAVT